MTGDATWGWAGPAWYGPDVVVAPTCDVTDQHGRCAIFDANGNIIGFSGLGTDDASAPSGTATMSTWMAGGLLTLLALGAFALEKKGPAPFRS